MTECDEQAHAIWLQFDSGQRYHWFEWSTESRLGLLRDLYGVEGATVLANVDDSLCYLSRIRRACDSYSRGRTDYARIRDIASDPTQSPASVTAGEFHDMLGAVPPLYTRGVRGFLVGEPITSDDRGTVYANYYQDGELFFARYHCVPGE